MELKHSCRSEYGPLELRVEATSSANGFTVYVEDSRQAHKVVNQHHAQSTLEDAQASAVICAEQYLASRSEAPPSEAEWRCS